MPTMEEEKVMRERLAEKVEALEEVPGECYGGACGPGTAICKPGACAKGIPPPEPPPPPPPPP